MAQELSRSSSRSRELRHIGCLVRHGSWDGMCRIHQGRLRGAVGTQYLICLTQLINDRCHIPRLGIPRVKIGDVWGTTSQGTDTVSDCLLIPIPTGKALMGCHDDCQDVAQTLIGHVAQDIFDIGWPVPHAHVHWQMHPTFVQEPFDGSGLLYGQGVEWREASQAAGSARRLPPRVFLPPHGCQQYFGRNTGLHCQDRERGDGSIRVSGHQRRQTAHYQTVSPLLLLYGRRLKLWTASTSAITLSTGVVGSIPCPRLKICPGLPPACCRMRCTCCRVYAGSA